MNVKGNTKQKGMLQVTQAFCSYVHIIVERKFSKQKQLKLGKPTWKKQVNIMVKAHQHNQHRVGYKHSSFVNGKNMPSFCH